MAYSRHPKGYDGVQLTTRPLGQLLHHELEQIQRRIASRPQEVLALWPRLVGPQIAPFTKAERFQEGILYVTVSNSTVYSLLASSEKASLLKQLQHELPACKVRNIVFRLG